MSKDDHNRDTERAEKPRDKRLPYRKPAIVSSEVFEQFTLQSCNQTPGDSCQGALE